MSKMPSPKPEGAVTILVLGILSLVVCGPLGIVAWIMGNGYMARCREMGVEPEGTAVAGRVIGMIVTSLMSLALAVGLILVVMWLFWAARVVPVQPGMIALG
jgi:hypothetical protein